MASKKGKFIVFEGIDGSGKTTQINLLKQKIENTGTKCLETREPSDGPVGVMIRQCLTGRMKMDEAALAALSERNRCGGSGAYFPHEQEQSEQIFSETTEYDLSSVYFKETTGTCGLADPAGCSA